MKNANFLVDLWVKSKDIYSDVIYWRNSVNGNITYDQPSIYYYLPPNFDIPQPPPNLPAGLNYYYYYSFYYYYYYCYYYYYFFFYYYNYYYYYYKLLLPQLLTITTTSTTSSYYHNFLLLHQISRWSLHLQKTVMLKIG